MDLISKIGLIIHIKILYYIYNLEKHIPKIYYVQVNLVIIYFILN